MAQVSSVKPRLLYLSHRVPWPPHNGAALRTYNLLKLLAPWYELHLLCFERPDPHTAHYPMQLRVGELSRLGQVSVHGIPQLESHVRMAYDHLRSVVHARPYTWYVHDSPGFETSLRKHLRVDWDLICVDSLDLVRWLPIVSAVAPVVLTHHNVESDLLRLRARTSGWVTAGYLRKQAKWLQAAEQEWLPRVNVNVAVSDEDRHRLQELSPPANIVTIPNGVDTEYFAPAASSYQVRNCVFVGGATWYPNLDGMRWYVREVLPHLKGRVETTWVGRMSRSQAEEFEGVPGLTVLGYVDDIRPIVAKAACFIVPLRVGSGTRLKLLDAWAMGKACVTTRIGAEGLDAQNGMNALVADSPSEFAESIMRVVGDASLRTHLENSARDHVVRNFSWASISRRWQETLSSAAQAGG